MTDPGYAISQKILSSEGPETFWFKAIKKEQSCLIRGTIMDRCPMLSSPAVTLQ